MPGEKWYSQLAFGPSSSNCNHARQQIAEPIFHIPWCHQHRSTNWRRICDKEFHHHVIFTYGSKTCGNPGLLLLATSKPITIRRKSVPTSTCIYSSPRLTFAKFYFFSRKFISKRSCNLNLSLIFCQWKIMSYKRGNVHSDILISQFYILQLLLNEEQRTYLTSRNCNDNWCRTADDSWNCRVDKLTPPGVS